MAHRVEDALAVVAPDQTLIERGRLAAAVAAASLIDLHDTY
jgi:hypothetical protein